MGTDTKHMNTHTSIELAMFAGIKSYCLISSYFCIIKNEL